MNNYTVVTLSKPEAKEYIRKCLESGQTLSKYVLDTVNLDAGYVTTALPPNGNSERLYEFEYGGIIPEAPESEWKRTKDAIWVPVHSLKDYPIHAIHSYIQQDISHICIFEDQLARPEDPLLKKLKSRIITCDDVIFHIISSSNNTINSIKDTISSSSSIWPPTIGFLTSVNDAESILNQGNNLQVMFQIISDNLEKIIVSAYDMEGYVVWQR